MDTLSARLRAARSDADAAIGHWCHAVAVEDGMSFDDVPDWYYPISRVAGSGAPEKPAGTVSGAGLSPGARPESPQSRSLFGLAKALAAQRKGMRQTSSGSRLPRPGRAGSSLQARISSAWLDIEGASRNPAEISPETRGRIARPASCGNQSVGGAADRTAIPIARRQTRSRIAPIRISAALRPTQMPGAPHRRGKHRTYATGSPTAQ